MRRIPKNQQIQLIPKKNLTWSFIGLFQAYLLITVRRLLLCSVRGIFNMIDLFYIFLASRNTKTLFDSNFWLGMYVPHILRLNAFFSLQKKFQHTKVFHISRILWFFKNYNFEIIIL